jgi:hypothetical protein
VVGTIGRITGTAQTAKVLAPSATASITALTRAVVAGGPANLITNAPIARDYFLGDYEGLTASGAYLVSFFANPNTSGEPNQTDIFSVVS